MSTWWATAAASRGGWLRLSGWHRWLAGFHVEAARSAGECPRAAISNCFTPSIFCNWCAILRLMRLCCSRTSACTMRMARRETISARCSFQTTSFLNWRDKHPEFLAGVSIHPARARCARGTGALPRARRGPDEVPSELPEHRSIRRALPPVLGANGGGAVAATRATGGEHTVPVVNAALADPKLLATAVWNAA